MGGSPAGSRRGSGRIQDLREFIPALARLLVRLARDDRVARRDKVLAAAVAAYLASPIDLLPGPFDDLAFALAGLRRLLRSAGYDVLKEHWDGTEDGFIGLLFVAGVEH